MEGSINLRQFAMRAQITIEAVAKGNTLPLRMCMYTNACRLPLITLILKR
jgi:hypothetical protein